MQFLLKPGVFCRFRHHLKRNDISEKRKDAPECGRGIYIALYRRRQIWRKYRKNGQVIQQSAAQRDPPGYSPESEAFCGVQRRPEKPFEEQKDKREGGQ